jgi:exodeoxyribonuclease VII large subunit
LEQRVDELEQRARDVFRRRKMQLAENRAAAALFEEKMASTVRRLLQSLTARCDRISLELHNLSPLNILKKGYTLCWKDDLQLIRRVEDVDPEGEVTVSFYKGAFTCRVQEIDRETRLEERLTGSRVRGGRHGGPQ